MAAQPRTGYVRSDDHVEAAFYQALTRKRPRTRAAAPTVTVASTPTTVTALPAPAPAREPWQPPARSRLTLGFWRRTLLRALGIPYPIQNVLLDSHRWTVTVTRHAIAQAGERYREGNPAVIAAEVAAAIAEDRIGKRAPHRSLGAWGSARLAWTADGAKTYVVRRSHRAWIVITALPAEATA